VAELACLCAGVVLTNSSSMLSPTRETKMSAFSSSLFLKSAGCSFSYCLQRRKLRAMSVNWRNG
jgi:hypothetical protein